MTKGIISGLIWGVLVAGVASAFLSLYVPLPERVVTVRPESAPAPEQTSAAETEEPIVEEPADTEGVTAGGGAQESPSVDIEEAEVPVTDPVTPENSAVEEASSEPVQLDLEETATPQFDNSSDSTVPQAPVPEDGVEVARPAAPIADADSGQTPAVATNDIEPPTPALEVAGATQVPSATDNSLPQGNREATGQASIAPADLERLSTPSTSDAVPETGSPPPLPKVEEDIAQSEEANGVLSQSRLAAAKPIAVPVPKLGNAASGVVTNRLPTVQSPNAPEAEAPDAGAEPVALDPAEVGALTAFRADVDIAPEQSLFSVILIDAGASGVPRDQLLALNLPVTIALDPIESSAAEAMNAYRAAGFEIAIMPKDLPVEAAPSDVAVALEGYTNVLSQAVAIMDPLDGRIQSNRSILQAVLGSISASGHGLITYNRGLNTAQRAAQRENVPASTVFRVLDGENEQAPLIKRYLDRAAFTAGKDGQVVVVGHSYPETITALLEWSLERKDGDLAIVPVSATMALAP